MLWPGTSCGPLGSLTLALAAAAIAHLQYFWRSFSNSGCLRMEAAQVRVGLARGRDLLDDVLRIEQLRLAVEIGAELRRRIDDAAAARIARVFQRRQRQLRFRRRRARPETAHRRALRRRRGAGKSAAIEAPVIGFAEFGDDRRGFGVEAVARHPDRRVDAAGVETGERGAILRVGIVGAAFGGRREFLLERDADGILRRGAGATARRRRRQRLGVWRRAWRRLLGMRPQPQKRGSRPSPERNGRQPNIRFLHIPAAR